MSAGQHLPTPLLADVSRGSQLLEARLLGTGPCGVPTQPTSVMNDTLTSSIDDEAYNNIMHADQGVNTTSANDVLRYGNGPNGSSSVVASASTNNNDENGLFSSMGVGRGVEFARPPPHNHSQSAAVLPVNDCSNVSSAGSVSDKTDPETTPDKSNNSAASHGHYHVPVASVSMAQPERVKGLHNSGSKTGSSPRTNRVIGKAHGTLEKKQKKRRRIDTDGSLGGDIGTKPKTPKANAERKISDFLTKQTREQQQQQVHHHHHPQQSTSCNNPSCQPTYDVSHIASVAANMLMERGGGGVSMDSMPGSSTVVGAGGGQTVTPTFGYQSGGSDQSNQSPPQNPSTSRPVADFEMQTAISYSDHSADYSIDTLTKRNAEMIENNARLTNQLETFKSTVEAQKDKLQKCDVMLKKLLIEQCKMERKERRATCMEKCLSLGQYKPERRTMHFEEVWYDGYAFDEVNQKLDAIAKERVDMQAALGILRKKRPPASGAAQKRGQYQQPPSPSNNDGASNAGMSYGAPAAQSSSKEMNVDDPMFVRPDPPKELSHQEYYEQDEIYRLRREQLKKEESDFQAELARLERERNLHIRELKRVQNEENSTFKNHAVLNKRYLLLSLLGKGGFSEVWHAFDLEETKYMACKIHHVNRDWKEDKKANYVKHAIREKDIHKTLSHARIVRLFDLFTIDNHSFCTVLEYCDGNDLDFYLKQNKTIPEKESRSIIMQLVSALRYLNYDIKPAIIHYDLKPANVLLSSGTASGEIKITDFGLSKVKEDDKYDPDHGMDLTSQGAGTYWYLPPECFVIGQAPPKICSKVDVWSVGVIFYQCLYGKRPFGDGQTQASILENKTILNATEVNFPSKPPVSTDAKAFIKRCLQYKKEERADVQELYTHEYLRPTRGSGMKAHQQQQMLQQQQQQSNAPTTPSA